MKTALIPILCLISLVSFYCKAYSDMFYLKSSEFGINVTVKKSDKDSLTVIIPKKQINDIMVDHIDTRPYPDILKLQDNNKRLPCKVLETDDKVVMAEISMREIASFNITRPNAINTENIYTRRSDKMLNTPAIQDYSKDWQLDGNEKFISADHGMIKGIVLSHGNLLAKCQVKVYRLVAKGFLFFKTYKQEAFYETITDNNGNYVFKNIPAGAYKLYWKESLGEPWMSRIEMEPDVIVHRGEVATISPLDIDYGKSD